MNRKGINYDVGTIFHEGVSSRETLEPATVCREIEIIRQDLHCNAIRISGKELERLTLAAEYALAQSLEVWFSPALVNGSEQETLAYFAECAKAAEKLRQQSPQVVFVAGCELTLFMQGLVQGNNIYERLDTFMKPWRLVKGVITGNSFHKRLNSFLAQAVAVVREHFHGQITYASGPWEQVDWTLFDIVSVDYYRTAANQKTFSKTLRTYCGYDKPVVITEFGCCTYKGAGDKGGQGWAIVDWNTTPPQLTQAFVRDESEQARYLLDLLEIFAAEKIDGAFVYTFVSANPYNENPRYDLDMASYGVVKTYADQKGSTYPDMPWEPKESFGRLAEYYGAN